MINNAYSFIFSSLLLNILSDILVCDLFSIMNNVDFDSYDEDNTPYAIRERVIQVNEFLKEAPDKLFCWFT